MPRDAGLLNCFPVPRYPVLSDFKAAYRGLRRSPAFTVAAIVTLALGIGANTTMFSVVNAVLLRPLPGYRTDRIVNICNTGGGGCWFLNPQVYLRLRATVHSFAPLVANQNCPMNLTGHGEPEQINVPCATANWFELQHTRAMLGRTFLPDEDQCDGRKPRGGARSRLLVQRRFGADPKIGRQDAYPG